jgi:glycosyltransferase involved in cell wall biosynthesis
MIENKSFPLVSIITPAYNAMPYLKTTIESVLNQEYPNLEHIVYDGGSKDNSVELLRSYTHLTWVSEKDRGQSHALNKGFAIAKGEIIGWLNADDTYTQGAINKAVRFLMKHPEYDMIGTDVNIIDENDLLIGKAIGAETDVVDLLGRNVIKQPSLFMRRRVVDTLKGVREDFNYIMDQEFWIRAFMNGFTYKYLEGECYANFRLIKGTKTFDAGPAFNEEWHNYTLTVLSNPYFNFLNSSEKRNILSFSFMNLYFSKMQLAINSNKKLEAILYYFKSIFSQPRIIFNLGLTKLLLYGLFERRHNLLAKFEKNESKEEKL